MRDVKDFLEAMDIAEEELKEAGTNYRWSGSYDERKRVLERLFAKLQTLALQIRGQEVMKEPTLELYDSNTPKKTLR